MIILKAAFWTIATILAVVGFMFMIDALYRGVSPF